MKEQDIYSQAMYETLACMKKSFHHSSINPLEHTTAALILTNHQNLIDQILSGENLGENKFSEILNVYIELWNFEEVLRLLNNYKKDLDQFDFKYLSEKLVQKEPKELILRYCNYINTQDGSFSYFYELLQGLWKKKDFSLAEEIIKNNLTSEAQNIFLIFHNLQIWISSNSTEISSAIEKFCNILPKNKEYNRKNERTIERIATNLIWELNNTLIDTPTLVDIPTLKDAIMSYEIQREKGIIWHMRNRYDLDKKIRNYYYDLWKFDEVEKFIIATGDRERGREEFINKKIDYAIKTKNKEFHAEVLGEYILSKNIQIQELNISKSRSDRCDRYQTIAKKYAQLAIFEILHWDENKAKEYVSEMIKNTEAIMTSIPEGISKRDKWHIKWKRKVPFKRWLKEFFLNHWLFHHLPAEKWWSNPLKDPEKRKEDRKIFEEQREIRRNENRNMRNRDENNLNEVEKTQLLKILLDENKIEEAIKFLAEISYMKNRADWERWMMILDYSKESFEELFYMLGKDCFNKRGHRDHADYDGMAQFFVKAHSMWIIKDEDWDKLFRGINNSRHLHEYWEYPISKEAVVSIVKYTIAIWDIDRAWNFFNRINGIFYREGNRDNDTTISACLSYFINATTNHEKRDGKYLAFKWVDIKKEKNVSKIDRIKYRNVNTNIESSNKKKYKNAVTRLQKNLLNSQNPTETIREWCRDLVKNNLRKPYQINNEFDLILNSPLWISEKIRRRIVYTLMELWVSWIESIKEATKKWISPKLLYFYLKKLAEKGYLTKNTKLFFGKDRAKHLPHLIKLLSKNPSEFNLVVDNIYKNYDKTSRLLRNVESEKERARIEKKFFKHSDWKKIFKVLNKFNKYSVDYECILNNLNSITKHPKWVYFWYFTEAIKNELSTEESNANHFPVTRKNFLDLMSDDEIFITFEKDTQFKLDWLKPWSKAWFLEKPERKEYLNSKNIKTFKKFGTIIWLWILEWSQDTPHLKNFYEYIFANISHTISRSSILQLWEVFNLLLKKEEYKMLDELVDFEVNIWNDFKNFIEENKISDKWRTILTLMIAREINQSFQIFKDNNWNKQIDNSSIKEMLLWVYEKFLRYIEVINIYKNVSIKTSIGIEYEVTNSIARGYKELTGSDYKNDILILSEYSWIARWIDAVHEIATKPTDNPYLLLLELKLLEDLDFLDLNFKREDYKRWARWLHISVGWEYGISLDESANFIQNILIAWNLWWLNVWEAINRWGGIRDRHYDCEVIFGEDETKCVEYRGLSMDKSEPFERLIMSIFNLNMAKQILDKYLSFSSLILTDIPLIKNIEEFKIHLDKYWLIKVPIDNERIYILMYEYLKLLNTVKELVKEHNSNFISNETFDLDKWSGLDKLLMLVTSTWPVVQIMENVWVDIYYFKKMVEDWIVWEEEFFSKLSQDWKNISITERQKKILYLEYKLRIRPDLEKIRQENKEIFENIWTYLNWNTEDTLRKITNSKRFTEVINWDKNYLESIKIDIDEIFNWANSELTNKFIKINNLFIKKDSTNALGMFDTTKEQDWNIINDSRLTETMIFDKLDRWLKQRKGYNVIQWAWEKMITQAIQREILEFNEKVMSIEV